MLAVLPSRVGEVEAAGSEDHRLAEVLAVFLRVSHARNTRQYTTDKSPCLSVSASKFIVAKGSFRRTDGWYAPQTIVEASNEA